MKKMLGMSGLVGLLVSFTLAQNINVLGTVIVSDGNDHNFTAPQFSPDGGKILFSEAGFKGLWLYDISKKSLNQLNDLTGAGYEPVFSPDGQKIYFRTDNYIEYKRYSSLAMQTIDDKQVDYLAKDVRRLSTPALIDKQTVVYRQDKSLNAVNTGSKEKMLVKNVTDTYGFTEDQKIVLVSNGVRKEMTPVGKGNYIWLSLAPDKTKMLFTVAGGGTFISDLNGNILVKLGKANAPKWSPDGNWILYMVDKDDGHTMTASDIWAVTTDGVTKVQLTNTNDDIEMYPNWSPAMDKIVYETFGGKIAFINIEIVD
jgi:Tol biopolymer transport system component